MAIKADVKYANTTQKISFVVLQYYKPYAFSSVLSEPYPSVWPTLSQQTALFHSIQSQVVLLVSLPPASSLSFILKYQGFQALILQGDLAIDQNIATNHVAASDPSQATEQANQTKILSCTSSSNDSSNINGMQSRQSCSGDQKTGQGNKTEEEGNLGSTIIRKKNLRIRVPVDYPNSRITRIEDYVQDSCV